MMLQEFVNQAFLSIVVLLYMCIYSWWLWTATGCVLGFSEPDTRDTCLLGFFRVWYQGHLSAWTCPVSEGCAGFTCVFLLTYHLYHFLCATLFLSLCRHAATAANRNSAGNSLTCHDASFSFHWYLQRSSSAWRCWSVVARGEEVWWRTCPRTCRRAWQAWTLTTCKWTWPKWARCCRPMCSNRWAAQEAFRVSWDRWRAWNEPPLLAHFVSDLQLDLLIASSELTCRL